MRVMRSRMFSVRLSAEEFERLQQAAEGAGVELSDFARRRLLPALAPPIDQTVATLQTVKRLVDNLLIRTC